MKAIATNAFWRITAADPAVVPGVLRWAALPEQKREPLDQRREPASRQMHLLNQVFVISDTLYCTDRSVKNFGREGVA